MDSEKHIDYFVVIAGRKKKDEMVALLTRSGARIIHTMYGKGSVNASLIKDAFGFTPEENKTVILCLLPSEASHALINTLNETYRFNQPNTGIAFTIPIEGLSH